MEHKTNIHYAGVELNKASKAVIMIHGRGGTAGDIVQMALHLGLQDYALVAPQATNNTWYPYSFMAAEEINQPWLDSALSTVSDTVQHIKEAGISEDQIYFFGFSQGACLTMEFLARNARKYGGAALIIGGLIGDKLALDRYQGNFDHTPIFIGTSDPDLHVPMERVHESVDVLNDLNASVTLKIYAHAGHTILEDEVKKARQLIFKST